MLFIMVDYTRSFHGKTIKVTSMTQLETFELKMLEKYIELFEEKIDDYTTSLKKKLVGVSDNCRPTNLSVNGQSVDVVVDALSKELEVLRDDYNEILGQIKYELKRYQQLKNESYEAYKRYLAEQKEKKEEKQTKTTANIPDWASRSHIPS